ncbi:MAG: hypothetical protein HYS81_04450 [Candidatus Aenigmatarchaeota archaeon]|nr:MAG: hypothetical protein HYS81_04450 [Candidatus Aenigmarchaeota archaeon]
MDYTFSGYVSDLIDKADEARRAGNRQEADRLSALANREMDEWKAHKERCGAKAEFVRPDPFRDI